MKQLVFNDKIIIEGKLIDVTTHLKELSGKFKTFKELMDFYMSNHKKAF